MGILKRGLSLIVIVVLLMSSLILVKPSYAQVGVTTPSMPEFGVTYRPYSYYVPSTYGVDPATGKAVVTHEGYYEEDKEVWISIANQPFQPYYDSKGKYIQLFYNAQWKMHGANSWEGMPDDIHFSQNTDFHLSGIVVGFKGYNGSEGYMRLLDYAPNSQIDFQVKAAIGYYTMNNTFVGQTSGWTNTQTLTIADNSSATNQTSTPTPSTPEFPSAIALVVVFLVSAVSLAVCGVGGWRWLIFRALLTVAFGFFCLFAGWGTTCLIYL